MGEWIRVSLLVTDPLATQSNSFMSAANGLMPGAILGSRHTVVCESEAFDSGASYAAR